MESERVKPRQTKLLINGQFVDSVSGKTFPVLNPATEEKICDVALATAEDAELAIKAARKAFDEGPWRKMSGNQRGKLLYKLADLIE